MYKYLLLRHDKNISEKKGVVNNHLFYLYCVSFYIQRIM